MSNKKRKVNKEEFLTEELEMIIEEEVAKEEIATEENLEEAVEAEVVEKNEDVISMQKFKVYSIVSEKAVMAKGIEDDKWYSKPNKNYRIGEIIE